MQAYEYNHATFGFTDGIYASTFYMATGFHGFHVLVGTIFLTVCLFRGLKGHFTAAIILVLKQLHGTGILLMLCGYSCLYLLVGCLISIGKYLFTIGAFINK